MAVHADGDVSDALPGVELGADDPAFGHRSRQVGGDQGDGQQGTPALHHWMISSARARMAVGMVRLSAFADLRLMMSSNLVSC